MQASPRVDVDEAPYAPGADLLYVTELEDAHDSIKLLKSDDNLEFLYTETLSLSDSDETSGQCKKTCLDDTYLAQLIAGIITCHFEVDLSSLRKSKSRTQQYSASGWSWMNLRLCKAFERVKISSVFSSFPACQTRALLEVESRHSPDLREEECCLYHQHEHISRVSFLVCLSVFACTPVHSNSPTTSTDSLACFAGALTKQLSDSFVS